MTPTCLMLMFKRKDGAQEQLGIVSNWQANLIKRTWEDENLVAVVRRVKLKPGVFVTEEYKINLDDKHAKDLPCFIYKNMVDAEKIKKHLIQNYGFESSSLSIVPVLVFRKKTSDMKKELIDMCSGNISL